MTLIIIVISQQAIELVQEIGGCISAITEDNRETAFCFKGCVLLCIGEMQSHSWALFAI